MTLDLAWKTLAGEGPQIETRSTIKHYESCNYKKLRFPP